MPPDFKAELEALKRTVLTHHPKARLSLVEEAYWFAKKAHEGQKRASGEDYFIHPAAVARMLAEKGLDEVIVSAALLHDVVEDTDVPPEEIRRAFGTEIYGLVDGLTKLDIAAFKSRKEQTTANIIKTIMASSKDMRVLVIKLFDKLHNMRTLGHLPKESQKRLAADALTIYVPLVHKLGMHDMKYELEDICFSHLDPENYRKAMHEVKKSRSEKARELAQAIGILRKRHPDEKWRFEEKHKSVYSVYSKMIAQNKHMREINDTLILNIITKDRPSCYVALGELHSLFKPIPTKIKDFIAIPEYMIYQALHTQVIGPGKKPFKAYILSAEMSETANDGVVALMKNGEKDSEAFRQYKKAFSRISSPGISDEAELAESLNIDFHNRAMIVFTEQGDVLNLPVGATALDFAFFQNEKTARRAAKAEVNGRVVPLWTTLNAGDRVKLFYSLLPQVNVKWESYVHSEKAKRMVERELKRKNISSTNKLVKFSIEYLDTPGIVSAQTEIMARNGLDMEIMRGNCNPKTGICSTDYYFRNTDTAKTQKAIKELRELQATLDLRVDYLI